MAYAPTFKDYYEILGIGPAASSDEVKQSFRTLAMNYHPDSNEHPEAHQKFLDINEAYQTLGDGFKRKTYDQRYAYFQRAQFFGDAMHHDGGFTAADGFGVVDREFEDETTYSRFQGICKAAAVLCVLFGLLLIVDFILAESSRPELILEGNLTTNAKGEMKGLVTTASGDISMDYDAFQKLGKGDLIQVYTTPIFRVTTLVEAYRTAGTAEQSLKDLYQVDSSTAPEMYLSIYPRYGIYNVFSFFLIGLLVTASMVLYFRYRPRWVVKLSLIMGLFAISSVYILLHS